MVEGAATVGATFRASEKGCYHPSRFSYPETHHWRHMMRRISFASTAATAAGRKRDLDERAYPGGTDRSAEGVRAAVDGLKLTEHVQFSLAVMDIAGGRRLERCGLVLVRLRQSFGYGWVADMIGASAAAGHSAGVAGMALLVAAAAWVELAAWVAPAEWAVLGEWAAAAGWAVVWNGWRWWNGCGMGGGMAVEWAVEWCGMGAAWVWNGWRHGWWDGWRHGRWYGWRRHGHVDIRAKHDIVLLAVSTAASGFIASATSEATTPMSA